GPLVGGPGGAVVAVGGFVAVGPVAGGPVAGGPVAGGSVARGPVLTLVGRLLEGPLVDVDDGPVRDVVPVPAGPTPRVAVVRSGAGDVFAWGPSVGGAWEPVGGNRVPSPGSDTRGT